MGVLRQNSETGRPGQWDVPTSGKRLFERSFRRQKVSADMQLIPMPCLYRYRAINSLTRDERTRSARRW